MPTILQILDYKQYNVLTTAYWDGYWGAEEDGSGGICDAGRD